MIQLLHWRKMEIWSERITVRFERYTASTKEPTSHGNPRNKAYGPDCRYCVGHDELAEIYTALS
jgi:hypothetical protein